MMQLSHKATKKHSQTIQNKTSKGQFNEKSRKPEDILYENRLPTLQKMLSEKFCRSSCWKIRGDTLNPGGAGNPLDDSPSEVDQRWSTGGRIICLFFKTPPEGSGFMAEGAGEVADSFGGVKGFRKLRGNGNFGVEDEGGGEASRARDVGRDGGVS